MVAGTGQSKPNGEAQWTLSNILDNPDVFEAEMTNGDEKVEEEPVEENKGAEEGYCIECEDQPANVYCETCADDFCDVCFEAQHRKGTRKLHKSRALESAQAASALSTSATPAKPDTDAETKETDADEPIEEQDSDEPIAEPSSSARPKFSLAKRAKSIPLRLTLQERKLLRLLESALHVSEYTDRVDILSYTSTRTKRAAAQIRELCSILSGLCLAADYKTGQELFEGRDFAANEDWFARVFEIGRRHKVMNPDKMRETYGKLIYLLMDAQSPDVSELLGFSPVTSLVTVYSTLEENGALVVLEDPRLEVATREIISPPGASGKVRAEVQRNIREKERAVEALVNEYSVGESSARTLRSARRAAQKEEEVNGLEKKASKENAKQQISAELLRQCIYSISDNSAFLRVNRDPCEIMIGYLKKYFHPTKHTPTKTLEEAAKLEQPSLAIRNGRNGARLSHDHSKQYTYVLQSLTLWREILGDMFHLWTLAETDLLSTTSPYRLRDTGQGLNRVQHAPKTSREMHAILSRAQRDLGSWVGSSVIHMGDHNVPNALLFIDKYSQVYRILLPITNVLSHILNDPRVRDYAIREFGGVEEATRMVLVDFFRSAFDGSGDSEFDVTSATFGHASTTQVRLAPAQLWKTAFALIFIFDSAPAIMPRIRQLSEQAKDYVTRSLVPSLVLENRLRIPAANDQSGPLSMKFHKEWRHSDCPVNKWYIQRTGSSTQLKTIEHWRNRRVPYHHEYLLMELADGAMCRLERVGEGSRAAAIGREGCTAHDIIQHFSPETYRNTLLAAEPSDLVVELDAEGFDLLDVLAICYGIQQCRRSSTYTIQRFDSHFLCATILIILARRIAQWEDRITVDDWRLMVSRTINKLQDASADAHDFFGLAISAFINTDQPAPRKFVLDAIQNILEASGQHGLTNEIAVTLWHKDLKSAAHNGLLRYMDEAVRHALNDTDPCATRIRELLGTKGEFDSSEDLRLSQFRRTVATQQAATLLSSMRTCANSAVTPYVMEASENAVPWMILIRSSLYTSSHSLKALQHFGDLWEDLISPCSSITKAKVTTHALPQVLKMTHIRNIKKFMKEVSRPSEMNHVDDATRNNTMDSVITATYGMIQQHVIADDYAVRVLVVANNWLNEKIWTRCLAVCVGREIGEEVNEASMLAQLTTIRAAQPDEDRRQTSVFKFIEDIQRRIRAHALEIDALGLATATVVQNDIEEVMSEIWRFLPREFVRGLSPAKYSSDTPVSLDCPDPIMPENAT
ncbi:hypothetical protein FRC11_002833 [Ceratobasidium sp. 423]|nr:hypothetical protein FRC11_002833 [Ceratobasidium sp. 423]